MKKEPIIAKWSKRGFVHQKEVNREKFFNIMESIKNGFQDNNEISTILCEAIPEMVAFYIDEDRNGQMNDPFILYQVNDEVKMLNIKRHHKLFGPY